MKTKILPQKLMLLLVYWIGQLASVDIQAQCTANFDYIGNVATKTVIFSNTSVPSNLLYTWQFGDNTFSSTTNPTKTYATNDTFTVCLLVKNTAATCFDTLCKTIFLTDKAYCNANFYDSVFPIDSTRSKRYIPVMANSSNATYSWNFGDGITQNGYVGTHTYAVGGTYTVCLSVLKTAPDSCSNSYCRKILVNNTKSCESTTYNVIQDPNNNYKHYYQAINPDTSLSFKWMFYGDTLYGKNAFKIFPGLGYYGVCLQVSKAKNGDTCKYTKCFNDQVLPILKCKASFSYYTLAPGVTPKKVFFDYTGNSSNIMNYWNFGDSTPIVSGNTVNHTFSAYKSYTVCQYSVNTISSTCSDTLCKIVSIRDTFNNCSAYFNSEIADSTNNKRIRLFPQISFDSTSIYQWTIDDSISVTGFNQIRTYSYGYHHACLKTFRIHGIDTCIAQVCDSFYVGCYSDFAIYGDNLNNQKFSFNGDFSRGNSLMYIWRVNNIPVSTQKTFSRIFSGGGIQNVCLTVISALDTLCSNTKCRLLYIPCISKFTYQKDSTNGFLVHFNNQVGSDTSTFFQWDFGDGQVSSLPNPDHFYAGVGKYKVCLSIYQPSYACTHTICDSFVISLPACQSYFSADISQFPVVSFTNLSPELASKKFLWSFGDGSFDSVVHPLHTYINDTVYKVCLMIRDVINPACFDTFCRLVNSDVPGCNGSFLSSLDSLYSGPGFRMNYFSQSNYTSSNTIFLWTFGDGDTATQKNPQHIYSQIGRYNVCLSIMNLLDSCFITDCKMVAVPDSLSNALPERLSNGQFHVFPNPVGSILIIESKAKAMKDLSFSLIDLSGKELLKLENLNPLSSYRLEIPMQDFDQGIYFLRIQGKEGILVYKLVK